MKALGSKCYVLILAWIFDRRKQSKNVVKFDFFDSEARAYQIYRLLSFSIEDSIDYF